MDRHTLEQTRNQVHELLQHGSPSCIRQANSIMIENFNAILYFVLELTKPKPKSKHTIADNYPAGGLTATEPCMFCENYEVLQAENERLTTDIFRLNDKCVKMRRKLEAEIGRLKEENKRQY